ncbi:YARHG domain-containing protein [Zavarzinia sp. CC-PAN008]|uniref:YARHG domain-containing protein n=1 Tax=Zavarzinia sp. CC-PAN008 TaxID=3243332 RepID=UPI003F7442AD
MPSLCAAIVAAGLAAGPHPMSAPALLEQSRGPALHLVAAAVPGRYPEASTRTLTPADLQHMSLVELRLMRNEILARHGYIFPADDVNAYFRRQHWYQGRLRSVSSLLSETERANLDTIRTYEAAQGAPLDLAPSAGANASGESPPQRKPGIPIPER